MPTPKLKIRNIDPDNPVTVEPDSGGGAVTIAAAGDKDLEARLLESKSFAALLAVGKLQFSEPVNPTKEQYLLARRVLPRLLRSLGADLVGLHSQVRTATGGLDALREKYNRSWGATHELLESAESSAKPADHLFRAVNHFLKTKPEEDEIAKVEAQLTALQKEDLAVTKRPFAVWLADFEAKKKELEQAKKRLAGAQAAWLAPLAQLKQALKDASDDFQAADPAADIGDEIPPFP
ncbi:MAG TPA: hypothetical protein VN493_19500 [Thermoanaerobaculia bacterium]|nr:hypothetical protein [Thermoanaerobaculia bacterium]